MKVEVLQGRLTKSTQKSACYDLYSTEDVLIRPQTVAVVGTGLVTKLTGCFALMLDRSGLAAKYGVSRRAGVIDEDYPGEWKCVLVNEGQEAYQVRAGDRVAQVLFLPTVAVEVVGEGVTESAVVRTSGLGSTGK